MTDGTHIDTGVSVIVPAISGTRNIDRCLNMLLKQRYNPMEIILLSGGGYEGGHTNDSRIKVVETQAGTSPAITAVLDEVRGAISFDTAVYINPGYRPEGKEWITHLTAPLDNDETGAVSGTVVSAGGRTGGFREAFSSAVDSLSEPKGRRRKFSDVVSKSSCAFRCDLIKELELDSNSKLPVEASPVELSMRIREAGYKIVFAPEARAVCQKPAAENAPPLFSTLKSGIRYGAADAFLHRHRGIDWLHGRIFMVAILSILAPAAALYNLPYGVIAAGLVFGWGWFMGFHIPPIPWEWPVALVNMAVYVCIILAVRDGWAASIFPPRHWHPAIIRQWLFVFSIPLSFLLLLVVNGLKTAAGGIDGIKSAIYLPLLIPATTLWHFLSGLGYGMEKFRPSFRFANEKTEDRSTQRHP